MKPTVKLYARAKKGYRVVNLLGGVHAWNSAKQPTEVDADYVEGQMRMPVCPF